MKEKIKLEIGDLVFAFTYRGAVNSALVGVVVRIPPEADAKAVSAEITVFTPNGFEQVRKESCQIISKRNK
jgi:hypothetical protein